MNKVPSVSERIANLLEGGLHEPADCLDVLIQHGLDRLPLPGAGATIERWRALAVVGAFDLSLTKLYEGHTDALAILAEVGGHGAQDTDGAWCVWAAEAPGGRTLLQRRGDGNASLSGAKSWCSGALSCRHALLTAWDADGAHPQLVAVNLRQPGISIDSGRWKAVGMANSMSVRVAFDGVEARLIGPPGAYLSRPGFWHGGAGIAACWYGGAVGIASALRKSLLAANDASGHKMASLGKVDMAVEQTAALLRQAAAWIDAHPSLDAGRAALAARLSAEKCAKQVIEEVGNAMGAAPFCLDGKFARAAADLPVFIRQSHADKDFAALGERVLLSQAGAWML